MDAPPFTKWRAVATTIVVTVWIPAFAVMLFGCEPELADPIDLSEDTDASIPDRANDEPEREGGLVDPEGPLTANDCRRVRGSCQEPTQRIEESLRHGRVYGVIEGVSSTFVQVTVEQRARSSFNDDSRSPIDFELLSPANANYDLIVYDATGCSVLASSNRDGSIDRATVNPTAIDAGRLFSVIVEVTFNDGECDREEPYQLSYRAN